MQYFAVKLARNGTLSGPPKKSKKRIIKKAFYFKKREGDTGIYQTVTLMQKLKNQFKMHPVIREFAMRSIQGTKTDKKNLLQRLYNELNKNINYVSDICNVETIQTPILTLQLKGGDCDDMALLSACLIESIGIQTRFVITAYKLLDQSFSHVYTYAILGNKYIPFDLTLRNFGVERPGYTRREIL